MSRTSISPKLADEIIRRDEADNNTTNGDPHEIWYRYGGRQLGYDGNNGTLDTDYLTSIDNRQRTPPTNPNAFLFGSSTAVSYADFSQALNPINSYGQGSDAGSYTVRSGDTLESIAANLWGDSSLWYLIAGANGLSSPGAPGEGRTLAIPANVMSNAHNASTFKPYDPAKAIGDLSPTNPKPSKKPGGCGVVGQIIATIIAVVVSHLIPIPVVGPVLGNLASQAFLIGIGQQSKINWKSVGITAIAGLRRRGSQSVALHSWRWLRISTRYSRHASRNTWFSGACRQGYSHYPSDCYGPDRAGI